MLPCIFELSLSYFNIWGSFAGAVARFLRHRTRCVSSSGKGSKHQHAAYSPKDYQKQTSVRVFQPYAAYLLFPVLMIPTDF